MKCILLNSFIGYYIDGKNMSGMSEVKNRVTSLKQTRNQLFCLMLKYGW